MPVSKLKNLAILILLLANAALLCLLVPRQIRQQQQTDRLREAVTALCAEQEVTMEPDCVPETVTLHELELADGDTARLDALTALLGEAPERTDTGRFTADALRLCTWHDDKLSLKFTGGREVSDIRGSAGRTLRKMGYEANSITKPRRLSPGIYAMTATQSILGMPVFSEGLTITYSNNALSDLEGSFFAGTLTAAGSTACINAAEAVVAFLSARVELGWVGSTISGLEQGYYRYETAGSTVRLTPVWKIVTDTGSFLIHGLSGEVQQLP
ncbi:MAG: hypothetical protein IJO88_06850 [Oscillospiraceae bacterium]|nr:hypothetical protein [Oscillospiraceae bacterium]